MKSTEVELEIPFYDVDMLEIAWHGHYVKYLEIARCKLFDEIGYNYRAMKASGYAWPVIDIGIRYAQPLRFQQKIRVLATIVEWENRLKIDYRIFDAPSNKRSTKAHTIQVAVDIASGDMLLASPEILLDKLGVNN